MQDACIHQHDHQRLFLGHQVPQLGRVQRALLDAHALGGGAAQQSVDTHRVAGERGRVEAAPAVLRLVDLQRRGKILHLDAKLLEHICEVDAPDRISVHALRKQARRRHGVAEDAERHARARQPAIPALLLLRVVDNQPTVRVVDGIALLLHLFVRVDLVPLLAQLRNADLDLAQLMLWDETRRHEVWRARAATEEIKAERVLWCSIGSVGDEGRYEYDPYSRRGGFILHNDEI